MNLTVIEQFVNTLDERTFSRNGETHVAQDRLTSVGELAEWLGLEAGSLDPANLATARKLRSALRAALSGDSDQGLAGIPLHLVASAEGQLRLAADTGVPGLDALVETVAVSVADGSWKRLKLCSSPDCRWAFYDTSRSGAGRWCSMEVCGNRNKTRAYRQRRAGA